MSNISELGHKRAFTAITFIAGKPVVFRGMARHMEAFRTWNDDGYLRDKFANVEVDIEEGKKENRSLGKINALVFPRIMKYENCRLGAYSVVLLTIWGGGAEFLIVHFFWFYSIFTAKKISLVKFIKLVSKTYQDFSKSL